MTTVLRLKRRRTEAPLSSLVLSYSKRHKADTGSEKRGSEDFQNDPDACSDTASLVRPDGHQLGTDSVMSEVELRLAGTVDSIDAQSRDNQLSSIFTVDREALRRKVKLRPHSNRQLTQDSEGLGGAGKSLLPIDTENSGPCAEENGMLAKSEAASDAGGKRLRVEENRGDTAKPSDFHSVDMDSLFAHKCPGPTEGAVLASSFIPPPKAQQTALSSEDSVFTCNGVPMMRQSVDAAEQSNQGADSSKTDSAGEEFVYDLYYTEKLDWQLLEDVCISEAMGYDEGYDFRDYRDTLDDTLYQDDSDSNSESNWRNDYPDEDDWLSDRESDVEANYGFEPLPSLPPMLRRLCRLGGPEPLGVPSFSHHTHDYQEGLEFGSSENDDIVGCGKDPSDDSKRLLATGGGATLALAEEGALGEQGAQLSGSGGEGSQEEGDPDRCPPRVLRYRDFWAPGNPRSVWSSSALGGGNPLDELDDL